MEHIIDHLPASFGHLGRMLQLPMLVLAYSRQQLMFLEPELMCRESPS